MEGGIGTMALGVARRSIAAQGLGVNARDGEAFLKAVEEGDANKPSRWLDQPASRVVNYRGYKGDTALHIVDTQARADWVGYLLKKGADPNIGDANGTLR